MRKWHQQPDASNVYSRKVKTITPKCAKKGGEENARQSASGGKRKAVRPGFDLGAWQPVPAVPYPFSADLLQQQFPPPYDRTTLLAAAKALDFKIGEKNVKATIGFVTPTQRHAGLDRILLEQRATVYELARQKNPQRWSKQARQWAHVNIVHLNPDTPQIKEPQLTQKSA